MDEQRSVLAPPPAGTARKWWVVVAVVALIALAGAWFWWQQHAAVPTATPTVSAVDKAPAAPATPAPAASQEAAIRYPLPQGAASLADTGAAPESAAAHLAALLNQALGRDAVVRFLQLDDFARRVVATVDNLDRPRAASRLWPVNPTPKRFVVEQAGDQQFIGSDNASRYAPFVQMVESIDLGRAVDGYVRLYPQLQQAYAELGYPKQYFNDRLIDVIDHLLSTPEPTGPLMVQQTQVKGPIEPTQPWLRYEFADPLLEALSAGQKIMLRIGPNSERRLKARLVELRRRLAALSASATQPGAAAVPIGR
jgi:hypothetical protein